MFDLTTNVLIWGTVYVDNDEISSSSLPRISTKLDRVQEHELRGSQDVVRCHLEADRRTFTRDSEFILSLDESDSVS